MSYTVAFLAFVVVAACCLAWQERRYRTRPAIDPQWGEDYRKFDSIRQQREYLDYMENRTR